MLAEVRRTVTSHNRSATRPRNLLPCNEHHALALVTVPLVRTLRTNTLRLFALIVLPCEPTTNVVVFAGVGVGVTAKSAVTLRAPRTVTVHVDAVPEHAPPHPVNVDPAAGAAVNVTTDDNSNDALHVGPQSMPAGLDVTDPDPDFCTVNG